MDVDQIGRYCGLFEQRLKAGQQDSIDEFLAEQQLGKDERLVAELVRVRGQFIPITGAVEKLEGIAATFDFNPPASESIEETTNAPPNSLIGTQEWSLDRTWSMAFQQPKIDITASLKGNLAADPGSRSNLVIQKRLLRTPENSPHQPADYDMLNLLGKGGSMR